MTEHAWLKVVGIAGTLIPIGGALIGLGIYVGNLTNQIEASRSEVQVLKGQVSQLQDILQKTQAAAVSGVPGPKGEKGDPGERGEQGPRGERGLQGEAGPQGTGSTSSGLAESQILQIVEESVKQKLASLPASTGGTITVALDGQDVFNTASCIQIQSVRGLDVLTLRPGQEFCDKSGELIGRIGLEGAKGLAWKRIGGFSGTCGIEKKCGLGSIFGATYVYERFGEDDEGPIFLLRKV